MNEIQAIDDHLYVKRSSPVFHQTVTLVLLVLGFWTRGASASANDSRTLGAPPNDKSAPPTYYTYTVVNAWPHDPSAFTQGLVFYAGNLLESTGLTGESTLRAVELSTGRVQKRISLSSEYFGEGLAVIGTRAYQITWQNHQGFIYDARTFQREGEFTYDGEGWGLTSDGRWLILSDGTDQIRFLDPITFQIVRAIHVTAAGAPIVRINELEWIKGEIFANVWMTNAIVRIDPSTGAVRGIIDFSGLLPSDQRKPGTDVLNGIAYDSIGDRLLVTGKRWPKIFEVRLIEKPKPK